MADAYEGAVLSMEGRGFINRVTKVIATPNAGADFSFTSEGSELLIPVALTAVFTASAAVATRQSRIQISNSDGTIAIVAASNTVVASTVARYSFMRGFGAGLLGATSLANSFPFPDMVLMPGETIASVTTAIDAADQWSAVRLTCLRIYAMSPERRLDLAAQGYEYGFPHPFLYSQEEVGS